MKKTLLTLTIILLTMATAMAGSDLTVKRGNKKFIKEAKGVAALEFNFEGATFDDKMPLTDKYPDIALLQKLAWDGFVEEFNDRCKNLQVVPDIDKVDYKILMKVTKIDHFVNVMGFIPGLCVRAWGTVTITDAKTGEVVLEVYVDEIDGGANPSPDGAFSDCFEELGKQFSKLK